MNRKLALKAWRVLPVIWNCHGEPVSELTAAVQPAPTIVHYHLHLPDGITALDLAALHRADLVSMEGESESADEG